MIIHIVRSGETINDIADMYGKNVDKLIAENNLLNSNDLAIGQTILVVTPEATYTVEVGDTLSSIAQQHNTSEMQLLRNNPFLFDQEAVIPGETLVIRYEDNKIYSLATFGHVFPYVDLQSLRRSLPFLTYLTINSYNFTPDGSLINIDDMDIINMAKTYRTSPVMTISSFEMDINIVHDLLNNNAFRLNLMNNIMGIVRSKGYDAINIDFPYIIPNDRQQFVDFVSQVTSRFNKEGIDVFVSLTISIFEVESGTLNRGYDFVAIGAIANRILILSHDFNAATSCIPGPYVSFNKIQRMLYSILIQIPRDKIILEMHIIGYFMQLPYIEGQTTANAISSANIAQLASQVNAVINYDVINLVSSFSFVDNYEYVVIFSDERMVYNYARIIQFYGVYGIGIWNLMFYPSHILLLLNVMFDIIKLEDV